MNGITHEQAQSHLQANADQSLDPNQRAALDAHLEGCSACQAYASELGRLENALRSAMQSRVNARATHTSVAGNLSRKHSRRGLDFQRALKFAGAPILAVAILLFIILPGIKQYASVLKTNTITATVSAVAVPTPSAQLTTTGISAADDCAQRTYEVQAGDTLESISRKFSVPVENIMEVNGLKSKELETATQLIIPLCAPTPSLTMTHTITPAISVTSQRP